MLISAKPFRNTSLAWPIPFITMCEKCVAYNFLFVCAYIYRYLFMYAAYTHDLRAHKFFKYKIKYRNKWIQQNGFTIYYLIWS